MDKPSKGSKDVGTCSVCWGEYKVLKRDGTLYKHGHGGSNGGPCPGSYKHPYSVSSIDCSHDDANIHDTQALPSMDALSSPRLEHIMWKAAMNRIPKAARVQCATAFSNILIKIANDSTNLEIWTMQFSFGPTIIAKPPREAPTEI